MKLKILKLHEDAIIPKYETKGSVGFDLHSLKEVIVYKDYTSMIRTGLAVEIPEGYEITVRQRSGKSLQCPNYIAICIGTIDSDYRGEIQIPVINNSQFPIWKVRKGERIAQAIVSPIIQCELVEVDELSETDRGSGGFGHTG